nr:retrovirus-related Pol polyprotein from transposon TNT 1-94 [Tanacetum cinerariifolium]
MARVTLTKSWLWHQRLSHLNFDTINNLAKNDFVFGLPKFKYAKEHLCPFCEQGKSKRASHPPKLVSNSKQRLHLLHMDLCGPMRVGRINGKRVGITHETSAAKLLSKMELLNAEIVRWLKLPELCRKPDISHLHVFGALCYPKNDREDIGKLGAKGDIGFFIGYSANYVSYRVYNQRTRKIMETMNVTFDKLLAMAFEQNSSRPGLQSKKKPRKGQNRNKTGQKREAKRIQLKRDKSEQNRIKIGQKQEAWRRPEVSRVVSVDRGRKTEENAKRMIENAYTVKELFKF